MKPTEARPFFRGLAAVVAIFGSPAMIVIGWGELEDSLAGAIAAFFGGGLLALAMGFVAVTGKIPLWLAHFLAPPSTWKSEDRR